MNALATPQLTAVAGIGLARALVQHGRIHATEAESLTAMAKAGNTSFIEQLLSSKKLSALQIAEFASGTFGLPLFDLDAADPQGFACGLIDRKLMQSCRVVPLLKRGGRLTVAVSDPSDAQTLNDVKFQSNLAIDAVVVEDDKLGAVIKKLIESSDITLKQLVDDNLDLEFAGEDALRAHEEHIAAASEADDTPVVKFIQKMLVDAIDEGASDLHFEPYEKYYRVRFRVDGELREVAQPPLLLKDKIASRIKVISRLDISEKRTPQDGRLKLTLSKTRAVDFRVSTLPTLYGEKIVMRVLDPSSVALGIDALGYEREQKQHLLEALHRPYGMILVTGPTGSGKTVSLYTCLNLINKPGINISAAEDPAEMTLPGINQVSINERAGLTFAAALKSFLRQDPDVIMVGEIRDLETAEMAVKAAQTGHLVLSTLHTNDAPTTLTRMMSMGIAPFNIASSVTLITAQRLARRLCGCKAPVSIPHEALLHAGFAAAEIDGNWQLQGPVGCEHCKGSGYRGRVGIYQVMPVSDNISRIIMSGGNAIDIADQARREGIADLRRSGLTKVMQGLTSLAEVMAVTNE